MSTISHPPAALPERRRRSVRLLVPELWAALAIAAMWLAVLFDAVFGPNFVSTTSSGDSTVIPSVIFVAVFAYLGTRVVAKYGFREREAGINRALCATLLTLTAIVAVNVRRVRPRATATRPRAPSRRPHAGRRSRARAARCARPTTRRSAPRRPRQRARRRPRRG